jgi:hypothetical protein
MPKKKPVRRTGSIPDRAGHYPRGPRGSGKDEWGSKDVGAAHPAMTKKATYKTKHKPGQRKRGGDYPAPYGPTHTQTRKRKGASS